MKHLNFNQLINDLSLNKTEAILIVKTLGPIELATIYGTLLQDLKSGDWDVALRAAKAADFVAPRLTEKYQIDALFDALLFKLNFQKMPALTPALEIKEAMVRAEAMKAIGGLVHQMDTEQVKTLLERLSGFVSSASVNVKRDSQAAKASLDTLAILVAKLKQTQKDMLLKLLEVIDKNAALEKPALESAHNVIGMLKPSFTHLHFGLHIGHQTPVPAERQPLLGNKVKQ